MTVIRAQAGLATAPIAGSRSISVKWGPSTRSVCRTGVLILPARILPVNLSLLLPSRICMRMGTAAMTMWNTPRCSIRNKPALAARFRRRRRSRPGFRPSRHATSRSRSKRWAHPLRRWAFSWSSRQCYPDNLPTHPGWR